MKTLTILSGKGGTGKTTLSASLAVLLARKRKIIVADCDADAPNLGLALGLREENFSSWQQVETNEKAELINPEIKKQSKELAKCAEVCNFGALKFENNKLVLNRFLCEGCGSCQLVCPKIIRLVKINNGKIGIAKTKYNFNLISGQLKTGTTGSGKIVSLIKEKAMKEGKKQKAEIILVDSAAGVGCPVIASIQGSDFILAVTEPTPSALNDLKRALRTVEHFRIPYGIVINKFDLNKNFSKKIENFAKKFKIPLLGKIPYNKEFVNALVNLKPIVEYNKKFEPLFSKILEKSLEKLEKS